MVLTVSALTGLIVLQVSLLSYAMEIKEQSFRHNAMTALVQISHALSVADASAMLHSATDGDAEVPRARYISIITGGNIEEFTWRSDQYTSSDTSIDGRTHNVRIAGDALTSLTLSLRGNVGPIDSNRWQHARDSGVFEVEFETDGFKNRVMRYTVQSDSGTEGVRRETFYHDSLTSGLLPDSLRQNLMSSVIGQVFGFDIPPLRERLDSINVDSIVSETMSASGIDIDYAFGIFADYPDSLTYAEPEGYTEELRDSDITARLFHRDLLSQRAHLTLYFPEREAYLWAQITPLVSAEVLFMLIIIACFAYTIRTIMKQRKFSTRLVDFINNMTHEFKTPISTVALATEAIARPDVLANKEKVLQFNSMIRTENTRMRNQAEKILQMAALEEGDTMLSKSEIDLHQIIRDAVESVSLQVEHRGGQISTTLDPGSSTLNADPLHIANIIHNLLDNAVKYSDDAPHITVRTSRHGQEIAVEICDHGIGLTAEHQKQAFQKYFRVPTGNIHNVKGFGLGLSYVKLMVEAHGGSVDLKSQPGKGTTVSIVLPVDLEDKIK